MCLYIESRFQNVLPQSLHECDGCSMTTVRESKSDINVHGSTYTAVLCERSTIIISNSVFNSRVLLLFSVSFYFYFFYLFIYFFCCTSWLKCERSLHKRIQTFSKTSIVREFRSLYLFFLPFFLSSIIFFFFHYYSFMISFFFPSFSLFLSFSVSLFFLILLYNYFPCCYLLVIHSFTTTQLLRSTYIYQRFEETNGKKRQHTR